MHDIILSISLQPSAGKIINTLFTFVICALRYLSTGLDCSEKTAHRRHRHPFEWHLVAPVPPSPSACVRNPTFCLQ